MTSAASARSWWAWATLLICSSCMRSLAGSAGIWLCAQHCMFAAAAMLGSGPSSQPACRLIEPASTPLAPNANLQYFLPWHFNFFSRHRPLPEAVFGAASLQQPLISTRWEGVACTELGETLAELGRPAAAVRVPLPILPAVCWLLPRFTLNNSPPTIPPYFPGSTSFFPVQTHLSACCAARTRRPSGPWQRRCGRRGLMQRQRRRCGGWRQTAWWGGRRSSGLAATGGATRARQRADGWPI